MSQSLLNINVIDEPFFWYHCVTVNVVILHNKMAKRLKKVKRRASFNTSLTERVKIKEVSIGPEKTRAATDTRLNKVTNRKWLENCRRNGTGVAYLLRMEKET